MNHAHCRGSKLERKMFLEVLELERDARIDFFVQAEDGIRDLVRSRGLGEVYKRQKSSKNGASFTTARSWTPV